MLTTNSSVRQVLIKFGRLILSTFIISQYAYFPTGHILCPRSIVLESTKHLRLPADEIHCWETRVIIDEGDPVAITAMTPGGHRAVYIHVYPIKGLLCASSRCRVGCTGKFASCTIFAKIVGTVYIRDVIWYSINGSISNEASQHSVRYVI